MKILLLGSGALDPAAPTLVPLSSGQLRSSQDEPQGLCCDTGQARTVACGRSGTDTRPMLTLEDFGPGLETRGAWRRTVEPSGAGRMSLFNLPY